MTRTTTGAIVFVAAIGTLVGLLGKEIAELHSWTQATSPAFIGGALMHVGAVIGAFVAGQVIPTTTSLVTFKKESGS